MKNEWIRPKRKARVQTKKCRCFSATMASLPIGVAPRYSSTNENPTDLRSNVEELEEAGDAKTTAKSQQGDQQEQLPDDKTANSSDETQQGRRRLWGGNMVDSVRKHDGNMSKVRSVNSFLLFSTREPRDLRPQALLMCTLHLLYYFTHQQLCVQFPMSTKTTVFGRLFGSAWAVLCIL